MYGGVKHIYINTIEDASITPVVTQTKQHTHAHTYTHTRNAQTQVTNIILRASNEPDNPIWNGDNYLTDPLL